MQIKELGHVVLYVTNLTKMADFYKKILGFKEISRETGMAIFSSGKTHHELLLIEIGGKAEINKKPEPGLYHIGFKIGDSLEELKKAYHELKKNKVEIIGTTDHTVTYSIYIKDPDGNELELYADVSDEWKKNPKIILSPPKPLPLH
ncbi:MAG: VOC family protein [Nanoarchaeota archaeon]